MGQTITKRAMFAEIHQDTREEGKSHVFAINYVKKDGTLGSKTRCRKSVKRLPGESGYRGNVNLNHVLLMENLDNKQVFEVLIDLITHYNGMRVNHTY